MTLRVLHITTVHHRYDVRITLKECVSLAASKYNVALAVQDGLGNEVLDNVHIIDIGEKPKSRILRILAAPWRAYKFAREYKPDIVHFHDPECLLIALPLKLIGLKVIYDAHEDVPRQIATKHWIPRWIRPFLAFLFELFENFVARRIDGVVCSTDHIKRRFLQVSKRAEAIKNFPILEEFIDLPIEKSDTRTLCYIGAITRERGILEVLDALQYVKDVKLIMAGPFQSHAFEEELNKHRFWNNVEYRGVVGRREIAQILAESNVGLVTLLNSPNQIESLPVKMFEYMASGTPFIASNFPLWKEIILRSNGGICVDPSSPEDIANAMNKLLSDQKLAFSMGQNGRETVLRDYNWKNEVPRLLAMYDSVISGGNYRE